MRNKDLVKAIKPYLDQNGKCAEWTFWNILLNALRDCAGKPERPAHKNPYRQKISKAKA